MVKMIADTHFGRKFKTGVPLHRKGEIEETIYLKFCKELKDNAECIIHLGDLFDSPIVSLEIIQKVFESIKKASDLNPDKKYIFIQGNHDCCRNSINTSAFKILKQMCESCKNILFITDYLIDDNKLYYAWNYDRENQLDVLKKIDLNKIKYIYGHFEEPVDPFLLSLDVDIFSGHIHKKHCVGNVSYIGSLVPISFGEESDNDIMETMDLGTLLNKNPEEIKNKRIRVLLKKNEELPTDINCLQLICKKEETEDEKIILETDSIDLDLKKLFDENLGDLSKELWEEYNRLKAE